ncbi:hypothetical protein AVEN_9813-1 [Araneus ventricosus]|uniref:Uncharacterized protein n=1 Tax=Araneus ventricosus TaxID=182803 RepID=A0A4Y2ESN9_ARAVE|nr:hypothetical protein AVEN_9813-1 [Araneus ventricosus]
MNTGGLDKLKEMVEAEFQANFEAQREELRKHAKQQRFKKKTGKQLCNLRFLLCFFFSLFCLYNCSVVWRTSRIQKGRDCGARLTEDPVIPANCVAPLADLSRTQ